MQVLEGRSGRRVFSATCTCMGRFLHHVQTLCYEKMYDSASGYLALRGLVLHDPRTVAVPWVASSSQSSVTARLVSHIEKLSLKEVNSGVDHDVLGSFNVMALSSMHGSRRLEIRPRGSG